VWLQYLYCQTTERADDGLVFGTSRERGRTCTVSLIWYYKNPRGIVIYILSQSPHALCLSTLPRCSRSESLWGDRYGGGCIRSLLSVLDSVVYFRAGYSPNDYPEERCWKTRELLDLSAAATCPTVAYQLVGRKKIQQVLDLDVSLKGFPRTSRRLISCEDALQSSGRRVANRVLKLPLLALANPPGYMFKPQVGGNNLYEEETASELKWMSAKGTECVRPDGENKT